MIILDTDHIITLKYSTDDKFARLAKRMADSEDQDFVTTAITLEEQMRGWLAQIARLKDPVKQVPAYSRLTSLIDFFSFWTILSFDDRAANQFIEFRKQKIRTATMDLKIASIAASQGCLLLTANTRDFDPIPGIRIEDWLN